MPILNMFNNMDSASIATSYFTSAEGFPKNLNVTAEGTCQIDTAQFASGSSSALFDENGWMDNIKITKAGSLNLWLELEGADGSTTITDSALSD